MWKEIVSFWKLLIPNHELVARPEIRSRATCARHFSSSDREIFWFLKGNREIPAFG
jgi:hypothetical protein